MVKRALIFLFVLSVISIGLHGCWWSRWRGFEVSYKWVDFEIRPMRIKTHSWSYPQFYEKGDIIPKNNLAFLIMMTYDELRRRELAQHTNFNVITKAMAWSQPDNRYIRTHSITSISVKTIYDYSDIFLSGADVTSLFRPSFHWCGIDPLTHIITFETLIAHIEDRQVRYGWGAAFGFYLFLMDDTSIGGKQRFEIRITLDDGTVLVRETDDLMLE